MNILRAIQMAALAVALGSATAEAGDVPYPFLQGTDKPALASGIGLLRDTVIAPSTSELRIWLDGIQLPGAMLRFRIDARGRASGDVVVYFDEHYADELGEVARHDQIVQFRNKLKRQQCVDPHEVDGIDTCVGTFRHRPDWQALLQRLRRLGVETLPDESQLPGRRDSRDGTCMVVELRNPSGYRWYHYCNPDPVEGPEGAAAKRIIEETSRALAPFLE